MEDKKRIQEYLQSGTFTLVKVSGMSTVTKCATSIVGGDQWELFYKLVGKDVPSTFNWTARMKQRKLSASVRLLDVKIKDF